MYFFILAGGYGHRSRPLSLSKPKPLFPLNGTPLLEIMLTQLREKGLTRGLINLHYLGHDIEQCAGQIPGLHLSYLDEPELTGSRILKDSLPFIDDTLLVVNGDVFLDIPLLEMRQKLSASSADGVLVLRESQTPGYSTIRVDGDQFLGVETRGNTQPGKNLMYTGAALFTRRVLESIEDMSFFDSLSRSTFNIKTVIIHGLWLDIGQPHLYFEADRQYRDYQNIPSTNSLSHGVAIAPGSQVHDTIIWENTVIGPGCNISRSIITGRLFLENAHFQGKIITADRIFALETPGSR